MSTGKETTIDPVRSAALSRLNAVHGLQACPSRRICFVVLIVSFKLRGFTAKDRIIDRVLSAVDLYFFARIASKDSLLQKEKTGSIVVITVSTFKP